MQRGVGLLWRPLRLGREALTEAADVTSPLTNIQGVMLMQYVTYENLFGFCAIIISIVGLFIAIKSEKK